MNAKVHNYNRLCSFRLTLGKLQISQTLLDPLWFQLNYPEHGILWYYIDKF